MGFNHNNFPFLLQFQSVTLKSFRKQVLIRHPWEERMFLISSRGALSRSAHQGPRSISQVMVGCEGREVTTSAFPEPLQFGTVNLCRT